MMRYKDHGSVTFFFLFSFFLYSLGIPLHTSLSNSQSLHEGFVYFLFFYASRQTIGYLKPQYLQDRALP